MTRSAGTNIRWTSTPDGKLKDSVDQDTQFAKKNPFQFLVTGSEINRPG
jgi:hypothetical protein